MLFNAAQVLPCYVIQMREDASEAGGHSAVPPPLSALVEDSLQKQEESVLDKKSRLAARVRIV